MNLIEKYREEAYAFICERKFNKRNLLIIRGLLYEKERFLEEKIFFEFYKNNTNKSIQIILSITNLKTFYYVLRDIAKGNINKWEISIENKKIIFNNQGISAIDKSLNVNINFSSIYEIFAIADDFISIAKEVERKLYWNEYHTFITTTA